VKNIAYNAFLPLGASLSLEQLQALANGLGRLMWAALPSRRKETTQCIAERLGLGEREARELAKASFRHSACSFLELFHARFMDHRFLEERIEYENPDLFQRMGATVRPVVGVSGHLGCWELLGGVLKRFNTKTDCHVVVRLPKDEVLAQLMMHMRTQSKIRVLPHRQAATDALGQLRRGGLCAFLVDHNCKKAEAQFLPFLGEMAAVNKGPAILALRAKAEVWPFFLIRLPQGRFRAVTLPCLDTETLEGSRTERIEQICRFYTEAVEQMVLRYPEQWFWMHRRWKTKP
jgi:KDO2-lipid IV(A) lauroyltransferase